jgi:NADH-quinone oxidoreductase subunit J
MTPEKFVFILAAAITLGSALMVVSSKKILHAALWLVASLFGVAMLYALLQASFFAVVQVVVYIGAIAILVIFAVMLTRRVMQDQSTQIIKTWWLAMIVAGAIFTGLVYMLGSWSGFWSLPPAIANTDNSIAQLGVALVSPDAFMLPFEVASVLLLGALIGSIFLAFQKK